MTVTELAFIMETYLNDELTIPQRWFPIDLKVALIRNGLFESILQKKNDVAFLGTQTDVITICQGPYFPVINLSESPHVAGASTILLR